MKSGLQAHNEIIEWASTILSFDRQSGVEIVVETPWSSVLKLRTSKGMVYLKQTPPDLLIEFDILNKCRNKCNITFLPKTIAENKSLHCFLMNECGDMSLRTFFNGELQVDMMTDGLQVYKKMQNATSQHLDEFIQLGVPDWRLSNLTDLYQNLVNNQVLLEAEGLDKPQIKALQELLNPYRDICAEIANYGIPDSLNHGDFHDNNMLIKLDTKTISIIDFGETTIDHPFLSLSSCLSRTASRYNLSADSLEYKKLHNACFEDWLSSKEDLEKILSLVQILLPSYAVFSHIRLLNATGTTLNKIDRMNNRVKNGLLQLSANMTKR